jgi:Protein of unknown function (DUF3618)
MSTDRDTLPGNPPTDEDLRHEVELTREELGGTLARLMYKVDIPARTREAVHSRLEHAKATADIARHSPYAVGGVIALLAGLVAALWFFFRR